MISKDVVILTKTELNEIKRKEYLRGVERGKLEECLSRSERNQRQAASPVHEITAPRGSQ